MAQTPSRSSLSRRVIQAASSFKAMLFRRLFRSSIYESIRPVLSGRMGWLETLSSLIGRGSQDIHRGGVLRVSAKERAKRSAAREFRRRFVMAEQLELRALMAADLGLDPTHSQQPVAAEVGAMVPGASVAAPAASATEIVFVDPGVTDPQSLMQGLRTGVEFVMLDGSQDGIAQISAYLQGKSGIQAIHLVGHGRAGEIYLGSSVLGNGTLSSYAGELAQIGGALTSDGDILVYGCETAQGEQGEQFLQQLAQLTSADVAGSNDITGAANLGGDWDLEVSTGDVGSLVFSEQSALNDYSGVLIPAVTLTASFPASATGSSLTIPGGSISVSSWATTGSGNPTRVLIRAFVNGSATQSGTFSSSGTQGSSISSTPTSGQLLYESSAGSRGTSHPDMNAALAGRSLSYSIPAGTTTIRFVVTATDNDGTSTPVERTVNIGAAPTVVIGNSSNPNFVENGAALSVASNSTVSDTDSANLSSMTITLLSSTEGLPPDGASESLSYTTAGDVTGSYNSGTGVLALSGSTTVANYQLILRSLTYRNTSDNPTTTNRLIRVIARDGTNSSTAVTSTVTITAVNDAPTISLSGSLNYTENAAATVINNSNLAVADVDSANLSGATVTVEGFVAGDGDVLGFTNTAKIFGTYTNGVLTLSGTATPAEYQAALRTVTYRSTSDNPPATKRLLWQVTDSPTPGASSTVATSTISITAVNDAPVVYLGGGTTLNVLRQFTEGSAVNIAPSAVIGDADSTQLQSLTITLTNVQDAGAEVLSVTGTTTGFTVDPPVSNNGTITVTIRGNQSLAAYSTLLQSVTYNNTSDNPTTSPVRTITVVALDNAGASSLNSAASTSSIALASINNPPVYNTGIVDQTLTAGLPFSFSFPTNAFTDAENDPLTYTAGVAGGALPAWLTFNATSRKFYGVPPTLPAGGITVTVTAKDPSGGTATRNFTITTVATLNGNVIASVGFATAYNLVNPQVHSNSGFYQEETNSFTTASSPYQGTNFVFFQDGVTSFSGNNVPGKLMYIDSSGEVVTIPSAGIGNVSRPIKTPGNVVKGYYMWNNFATTGSVSDDTATLLVVDPNYFTGSTIYNSSSDQVDAALNGYLTAVTFDIASASALEGTASSNTINFIVTRSSTAGTATVQYSTSISGIDTASTNDFVAASGTYTFPAGLATGTITITTRNDAVFENNETFTLTLSNPLVDNSQGRLINSTATGTITNDDTAVFTVAASGTEEGTPPGLGNAMTFTVTRVGSSALTQSVSYATALRGTGSGFASADDFTSVSGTLTFLAGETTKTFTVTTVPDNIDEPNEVFDVVLTNPTSGASVSQANGSAIGTIEDDETNTIYSVASSGITEGGTITFTITRSRLVDTTQTISFYTSTTGDTATSGTDFTARVTGDQTVTFATNELTKQITVSTIDDTLYEGNETLTVVLDALQNLGVGYSTKISSFNGSAKGTIVDNDTPPVFSVTAIDGDTVESVNGVGQTIRFRVSRNVVSQPDQTVDFATVIGTATEDDFVPVAGTLTFPNSGPDSLSQTVTVTLKNDAIVESTESFTLQISNPTGGATLGTSSVTGTILDSNKPPVAGGTITTLEDTSYVIQPANIYTDPEGSGLSAIDITGLPDASMGYLQKATTRDANGVPLEAGWVNITATGELQISGLSGIGVDGLRFKPADNKFTTTTPVTFTLRVNDGAVWSTAAGTVTINITPVNDAPAGTDVSPPQSAYVGGFITLTESNFLLDDSIDSPQANQLLGVVFTDVPERPNPPAVPNEGALQVQVGENSTSRTGTVTGARDIRTSAFSQSTNTGSPQFVNADSASLTYEGITYNLSLKGRYGTLYLKSSTGQYYFEQFTGGPTGFRYIARYEGTSAPYSPVYEPLSIPAGTMVSDGFLFDVGQNGGDFFRRTLTFTLTGNGSGGFDYSSNLWSTVVDGDFVPKTTITDGKLRYSPCFCGVARYKRDGSFQLTTTPGTFTTIKFQVKDDGGTANGGVDLDQSPNNLPITLVDGFSPVVNVPNEQYFNEDTTLSFNGFNQTNAFYVTYAPPSGPVNDLIVVVELDSRSRPGSLSLDGSWPSGVTATDVAGKTTKYQIEGNTAFVNSALAALNFTPDPDQFSTTDLGSGENPRYPGLNGIGTTDAYAILKVSARNKPESGQMQYPTTFANVDMSVLNVNDAPVASGSAALPAVVEDTPAGSTISALFSGNFSDSKDFSPNTNYVTSQTLAGIAIITYSPDANKGVWQYSENGASWTAVPARSNDNVTAFALPASYQLRFAPAANYNGSVPSITARLIESSATAVSLGSLDVSTNGGETRFSQGTVVLSTSVTAVNDAPIASGAATLASISEDSTNPAGDTVSNLFSARFNDSADQVTGGTSANSLAGIAITNYTRAGSKGEWQYSTDGGTSWTTISASISGDSSALTFLSTDRLRFLPKPDFNGPAPTLTVRLLETPRSITSGATVDVSTNGGSTTISGGTVVLSQSVSAVNDAPVASGSATLTAINEDTTNPQGSTVLNLFAGNFSDAKDQVIGGSNANNFLGVAVQVHTQDASRGYWEYTSDSSWPVNPPKLATVTGNNAILLRSTDRIRFVPALNYNGPATPLVVRLLDNSNTTTNAKTAGAIVDTSTNNGTTEISSALVTLTHTVNPVNDPPISTNNTITFDEDQVRPLTTEDFGNYSDVENQPFSAIKIVTRPDKGTLQYNVGGVWTPITTNGGDYAISDASIKLRYIPAQNENGNNYTTIVYQVSDGVDFSASNYTVTINVTPVNDPPISTGDAITSDEDALYYFNLSDFGTYSDVEGDSLAAVQITSLPSLGTLEYDNGTGWVSALGAQIAPSLLTGNSDTSKLRYMPPANAFGSPFTQFGFKVSDGSAYSLDSYTVTINIAPVNDAPEATGSALLASVFKNDTNPAWATVSSLFSGNFSDPRDTGDTKDSFYGVAIRALTQDGAKGHWQYKIGSTVGDVPDSTDSSSFVLQGADSLRFVPASGYTGNATSLSVRLIETKSSAEATASGPSDASGSTANVSSNGGTTVYSAATVSLIHEVKGTLLVKAFNDVSEGSDAIFCVSLDSNASGTGVTLGLTSGTASSSSDYGPGYKEAYYYDGSNNKQTLTINGNSVSVPQGVTVFFVSVQTTNDSPKVYEGPETFTLSASITVDGNTISNSDAATIRDDGNGVVFNPDGTVNNSATPDNDLSVSVTGYGPVNEGSTYAMFKVDASSGDALNLSVINGTATLVTPMIEFSLNGTTWTLFNASATGGFPTVPAGAGNIGTVYVRVTITSESDSMYEGSESFSLKATSRTNSSTSDTKSTSIVDDGTGLKYAGDFTSGSPDTNATSLDNDLSVSVTSYSPVNEGSTWAMFKVVGTAGDTLSLNVTDIETSLSSIPSPNVPPMWHSINGTSWILYSSSNKPTVPGTSGTGIVYVRVNITAEQETALDTSERFTLTATSSGQGNKSGSADTMILDNGSGTIFTGDFGNDLPQVSSNFRDDDRVIAVRDKVFSRTASGVVLTDVRANDTTRNGATISAAIGLNPLSSTVSSTFSNAEGTWTVLSGGEVRFAPVASQKTDPTPIDYAVSVDNGSNYSLNKAQLFVDYGVGVVPDSVNAIPSTQEFVRVDVLLNDTLADTYDSDTLKLVDVSNGNALVEFLDVVGQGVWRVVAGTGSSLGRKVLEFQANMSGGVKSFAGNPSPVTYAVRDLVTDGGYRGGNLSSFTTATISYAVSNANPFLIRINDRNNDATSNGLPWDVIVVDNKLAGESVDLYDENGIWSQTIVTTAADASNTVGQIFYQGATTNFSTVKVDAKSKPVTVGSVANINLSTTTQSRRAAAIEIQAFDSLFIAQSTSSTNVLVSPMSGTQSSGSTTTFRESLGRVNQLFPTSSILGSTAGNVVENHQSSTARTVSISRTSGQFSQTAGQSTSLMKSLVTTNTGASQVVSLNAGGKVVESDPDGSVLAGINGWFFGVGLSKALEEARTLEQSGAWTTAIFMPSSEGMNAQGSQKTFENFENSVTTFGVSDSLRDVSVDEVIMVSNAFVNLESEDASRSKKVLANDLRSKKIGKRQES
jgi:hypothetical protein